MLLPVADPSRLETLASLDFHPATALGRPANEEAEGHCEDDPDYDLRPDVQHLFLQSNELDAPVLLSTLFGRVVRDRSRITVADRNKSFGIFTLT